MTYENRPPPEGINVSESSPVLEFLLLLGAVLIGITVLVFTLSVAAGTLARFIPFSVEERLAGAILPDRDPGHVLDDRAHQRRDEAAIDTANAGTAGLGSATAAEILERRRSAYLAQLAHRLAARMDLPDGMQIHLHYVDQPLVNAFATLGGHIFVYQGLIEALDSENALALVLGHEIGHIRGRHPIVAAGRGITVSLAIGSLFGLTDNAAVQGLVNWLGVTSTLSFSRAQELAADALAATAVTALYGHLQGAGQLFEVFRANANTGLTAPEWLSTHPDPVARERRILDLAASRGATGALTPLPEGLFSAASQTE